MYVYSCARAQFASDRVLALKLKLKERRWNVESSHFVRAFIATCKPWFSMTMELSTSCTRVLEGLQWFRIVWEWCLVRRGVLSWTLRPAAKVKPAPRMLEAELSSPSVVSFLTRRAMTREGYGKRSTAALHLTRWLNLWPTLDTEMELWSFWLHHRTCGLSRTSSS